MGKPEKVKMVLTNAIAVVAGGHHSAHPVFRIGAAPEKIGIVRTGGNNILRRLETGLLV